MRNSKPTQNQPVSKAAVAGLILAIIPIFYYSFIKPVNWFVPFAVVFCFLIDYKNRKNKAISVWKSLMSREEEELLIL